MPDKQNYAMVDFDEVPAIDCLCSEARRAFAEVTFSSYFPFGRA